MKLLTIAITTLFLTISTFASAPQQYRACTKDSIQAELIVVLPDNVKTTVKEHIGQVFSNAAKSLSYDELSDNAGYQAFMSGLSDEDKESIEALAGPPQAVGKCEVK